MKTELKLLSPVCSECGRAVIKSFDCDVTNFQRDKTWRDAGWVVAKGGLNICPPCMAAGWPLRNSVDAVYESMCGEEDTAPKWKSKHFAPGCENAAPRDEVE